MRIRIAVPEQFVDPTVIDAALEAVTRLDESMIRQGQAPTSHEAIAAGAIWRPENMGDEHFDHAGTIATRGWGDCDDWAPLHAATLRASGEDPGAVARVVPSGPSTYHAIVQRTDGAIEDPSVAAGMKPARVGEMSDEHIHILACDPHDGRVYEGQLAPTVGPLSLHCGPGIAVRGCTIVGVGKLYQARCDVPLIGSPLVRVHSYYRRKPHHRGRRVHGGVTSVVGGELPYALSVSAHGRTPAQALGIAIQGAILCGDVADMTTSLDRYKLLAAHWAMSGASAAEVHEALVHCMHTDIEALAQETGQEATEYTAQLLASLAHEGVQLHATGSFPHDVEQIATGIVHAVGPFTHAISKAVGYAA
jgi:hypothetical protein